MLFKKNIFMLIVAFALVVPYGCDPVPVTSEFDILADAGDTYFTNYTTPSTDASPNIAIADLFQLLSDGDDANDPYIIDYRSAEDFDGGHLKGAINASSSNLEADLETLPLDKLIVNVCYTGQTASFATAVMNLAGQDDALEGLEARNLLFGMCSVAVESTVVSNTGQWAGQIEEDEFAEQLEATANTTETENEFPVINTGSETLSEIIAAQVGDAASDWMIDAATVFASADDYYVINYWPENEYLAPGHIPGAYQFTPKSSLQTTEDLNLLPTDKTIVVYCYTGQTSAQVTAYLRMLGYDAKSLKYGFNGFAYNLLEAHKYSAPTDDYSSIIE